MVATVCPKDKLYDEIVSAHTSHFSPKPLFVAERDQQTGESVALYKTELRRLSLQCRFNVILTKHFATGWFVDYGMRAISEFVGEAHLTLAKAMDIAQGGESAECKAKSFKNPEVVVQNVVSYTKGAETRTPCYRCDRPNHVPPTAGCERLNAINVAS